MRPSPALIEKAKQGFRWCSGHGELCIHPDEPEWKKTCSTCHADGKAAAFCFECGERLPGDSVAFFERKGIPHARCWNCKHGHTHPHPIYGVKVPTSWYASLSSAKP